MKDEYLDLLLKFNTLPRAEANLSIFDVSGYPHYENVCSNVLAFYLDPQREHALGTLLLASVMDAAKVSFDDLQNVKVQREYPTISGGRLDLLITSESHVIGIENKIFHYLANDLCDYRGTIDKIAGERTPVRLVLSPRFLKIQGEDDFKNITYGELWARVKSRLESHTTGTTDKWVIYLMDFMSTTQGFSENGMELELNDMDQFFIANEALTEKFLAGHRSFMAKFNSHVNRLRTLLDNGERMPPQVTRRWIYDASCLVHELTLSGHKVALDLYFGPQGWKLQLFGRGIPAHSFMMKLTSSRSSENSFENDRFTVKETWPLDMSLDEVELKLRNWIDWVINAANGDTLARDIAEVN